MNNTQHTLWAAGPRLSTVGFSLISQEDDDVTHQNSKYILLQMQLYLDIALLILLTFVQIVKVNLNHSIRSSDIGNACVTCEVISFVLLRTFTAHK